MKHSELTDKIIGAFYQVYNTLGYGFLEKVYENALQIELNRAGLKVEKQKKVLVYYENIVVGDYCCDMIIDNTVLCELKSSETISPQHETQLINYLKATGLEVGLLLNFGKKPEIRRKVFDNDNKNWRTIRIIRSEE